MAKAEKVWESLSSDVKTYLTLASSLLGLSAAFADKLLGDDTFGRRAVYSGWALLAVALICGFQASAGAFAGLRDESEEFKDTMRWLDRLLKALLASLLCLVVGAWRTTLEDPPDRGVTDVAIETVSAMSTHSGDNLIITSIIGDATDRFRVVVDDTAAGVTYNLVIDASTLEIIEAVAAP